MRNIFIWDIHGCFDEFQALLEKLNVTHEDKVYILWDMINRWPKSVEVISFLYENQNNFFSVKWNHEVWFLKYINWERPDFENPEYIKLKELCDKKPEILNFIENLPTYIETTSFRVVHAWMLPWIPIEEQTEKVLTEIYFYKELPWYFSYPRDEKLIFYGHWVADGLHIRDNTIWLDTGCSRWKYLTAYILEEQSIVQIPANKQYFTSNKWWYEAELAKKWIFT